MMMHLGFFFFKMEWNIRHGEFRYVSYYKDPEEEADNTARN